jgi:DUF1680 family protein
MYLYAGMTDVSTLLGKRTLYNGYLSGVSLSGDAFFYQNPLVSDGKVERSTYCDVACCPANLARLMAQLPGLIYAPERPIDLTLAVRIPGWSRGEAMPTDLYRFAPDASGRLKSAPTKSTKSVPSGVGAGLSRPEPPVGAGFRRPELTVNGKPVPLSLDKGFARIRRRWQKGDVVQLDLPMPIRRVLAHDGVAEYRGKAAIERGPVVYAVEAIDNGGTLRDLQVPLDAALAHEFRKGLLGGVVVITGKGLVAIPYFAWANRGKGETAVWLPR